MIIYQKKWLGLFMLTTLDGSPALRALLPALASCLLAVFLNMFEIVTADRAIMEHPYPYQVFCFVVGFLLVFRTTFAYNRYQQAVQNVALMTSKWGDVALQLCCFHTMISSTETVTDHRDMFRVEIVHLISLLHAVALLKVRGDDDLSNLKTLLEDDNRTTSSDHSKAPPLRSNVAATGGFPNAWSVVENNTSLWQVIGSEKHISHRFDFHGNSKQLIESYHRANPLHVIGGLSRAEISSLSKVDDKCFLVMQWVVDIVAIQGKLKLFDVEGPIVSRIYQELSDGMLGYNQARKLTEIPFPWPYAQLVTMLLFIYSVSVPFLMAAWLDSIVAIAVLTTVVVWCYYAINEVNRDIEDPFIRGPNDLPLSIIQNDLNRRLQSLQPVDRTHRLSVISHNIGEFIKQQIDSNIAKTSNPPLSSTSSNSGDISTPEVFDQPLTASTLNDILRVDGVSEEDVAASKLRDQQLNKFLNLVE